ncbi:hypothetical protein SO694_00030326 [Aureococcus anophagefferens]|uniref:BTB domain-containing protein n=1 Tax=Aureococcus anophagefferens TaxID=44056 RepID=A0ABR1FK42_AURAN
MAPEQEGDDLDASTVIDTFVDDARLKLKRATASLEAMRVTASTKLAAAAAKHAAARRALEDERRTFDREVREAEARNARAEDVVTLNVGGTMFTTSVETLCADADSMLAAMFSGRHALRPADDGSLFIDRDPKHFGLVLNFLRDGPAAVPPALRLSTGGADEALRAEIFAEANYYQVLGLAALVSGPEERLLACAAAGGSVKHDEDRLRALVVREPGHATLAMAALLASGDVIDAHAEASAKTFVDESGRAPPAPIVLGGGRRAWRLRRAGVEPGGSSIASRDEFVKNWRTFTLGRLDRLNWTGVVAAGGAVAACALPVPKWAERDDAAREYFQNKTVGIEEEDNDWEMRVGPFILYHAYWSDSFYDRETGLDHSFACHEGAVDQKEKGSHISGFEESDIDLFLVGLNPSEALEKIKEIHKVLKAAWAQDPVIIRTKGAITFAASWPLRRVQVILRLYSSPAEVLMGFDIDSCCAAYDGTRLLCLPRFRRAVNSSLNLVDPSRRSPSYESRLRKYALRGFAVSVPAYDPSRVVASAVLGDAAKTEGLARLLLHAHEDSKHPTRVPRAFERLPSSLAGSDDDKLKPEGPVSFYAASDEPRLLDFGPHGETGSDFLGGSGPIASINCYLKRCVDKREVGEKLPFLATTSIKKALKWPKDEVMEYLTTASNPLRGAPEHRQRMDERLAEKRFTTAVPAAVEFIEQDPGRQYVTGSWEPGDRDWYASAYGEAPAAPAFPPLKTPRRAPDPTLLEGVAVACGGDAARVAEAAKAQGYSDAEVAEWRARWEAWRAWHDVRAPARPEPAPAPADLAGLKAAFNELPPEQKKAFHEYAFLSTEFVAPLGVLASAPGPSIADTLAILQAQLPSIEAAAIKAFSAVSSGVAPENNVPTFPIVMPGQIRIIPEERLQTPDGDVGAAAPAPAPRPAVATSSAAAAPARRVFVFPAPAPVGRGADTPAFSFGATAPAPPATSDAAAPAPAAPATADVTPISSFASRRLESPPPSARSPPPRATALGGGGGADRRRAAADRRHAATGALGGGAGADRRRWRRRGAEADATPVFSFGLPPAPAAPAAAAAPAPATAPVYNFGLPPEAPAPRSWPRTLTFVAAPAPAPATSGAAATRSNWPLGHPADPSGFIVYEAEMQQQHPAILEDPNGTAFLRTCWASLPVVERDRYRAALAARRPPRPASPPAPEVD